MAGTECCQGMERRKNEEEWNRYVSAPKKRVIFSAPIN